MIRGLVDFALNNRIMVLALAVLLFIWGGISFHNLPVEAYPDVANNYVEIITQWPGISAEQIEQQVSIPIEIVMNGMPHLTALRSFSLFGLSDLKLTFDDESENDWNRENVLERLAQVTLPNGVQPQMGTDWSPVGQIFFFTLHSTNPKYDVMELKTLEDWVVEKAFKSVPNVVDVASFGGPTREYQVRIDPTKLIAHGLSIGQVEQQLTNNNANAGGSFIEEGLQQINVREVGLVDNVHDIENTVLMTKTGTPLHVRDIAVVSQGPKIRLGQFARARHLSNGKIIDNDDVVSGIVLLRKGADSDTTLEGIHKKVAALNADILPPGVTVVPFLDRREAIENIRLLAPSEERVSLAQLANLTMVDGASEVYREANQCYVAIKYSVRGRDLGGAVEEAIRTVGQKVPLPPGYHIDWSGEYESQQRAQRRLAIIIPLTLPLIFMILYSMFRSFKWSSLILVNVFIAPVGGLLALFGVSVQVGVIIVEYINQLRVRGRTILEAAQEGAILRLRPIMMTMLVAMLGLLPAATSHGIGSDSQRPFAIVIVGGLMAALLMSVFLLPTLYVWMAGQDDVLPEANLSEEI